MSAPDCPNCPGPHVVHQHIATGGLDALRRAQAPDWDAVDRATARAALNAMPRPLPGPIEYERGWRLRHWTWTVIDRRTGSDLATGRTATRWGAHRRRHRAYNRLLNAEVSPC